MFQQLLRLVSIRKIGVDSRDKLTVAATAEYSRWPCSRRINLTFRRREDEDGPAQSSGVHRFRLLPFDQVGFPRTAHERERFFSSMCRLFTLQFAAVTFDLSNVPFISRFPSPAFASTSADSGQ